MKLPSDLGHTAHAQLLEIQRKALKRFEEGLNNG